MRAVALVIRRRLATRWRAIVVVGVVLGLGFGLSCASFASARRTESAYDRILLHADAPDAAVALGPDPIQAEKALQTIDGIDTQRVYAGFTGRAEGVDGLFSTGLLAPIHDRFPVDLPTLADGRLPDPDAPDEVFVTSGAAERGDLKVGQRLRFHLVDALGAGDGQLPETATADVTIVGIGTLPLEAVADETTGSGVAVFSRAFYDEHRDLVVYSVSNVDLAPGIDARRELAAEAGALGYQLQSSRSQEHQAVDRALRPLLIVLVAVGVLSFAATAVAAALVIQRSRFDSAGADATLITLGMTRDQIRLVGFARSGAVTVVTLATAIIVMGIASPLAPVGPLHDLDPAQGPGIDLVVAAIGAAVIVVTIALLTLLFSSSRRPRSRRAAGAGRTRWLTGAASRPSAIAGIALAWRGDDGRGRVLRGFGATVAVTVLVAMAAAFVASAAALTGTSSRYGFDADVLALNAYGDQDGSELQRVFGDHPDVESATGFTAVSFLIDGRAVPGLAATAVKGDLFPTLLSGTPPRTDREIVVGQDTLDDLDAEIGDVVSVQLFAATGAPGGSDGEPVDLRIVGVGTFPPVNQTGSDQPRLGIGALVSRAAFIRMNGNPDNQPEFTAARMVPGADADDLIAENQEGFTDSARTTTSWFTGAEPAELRQLDAAMPFLRGGLLVGYAILVAIMAHELLARTRANRHDVAVLHALGASRGQLDAVTLWQVAPVAVPALVFGVPLGVLLGSRMFTWFAQSLAVVDTASISAVMLAGLVGAVLVAAAGAGLVAVMSARRSRTTVVLRTG